ncbi:MAG: glycosyltransferase [Vicinamibacterales bacterium]
MPPPVPIAAFIDLSALSGADARESLAALARADRLGALVSRAVVVAPPALEGAASGSWTVVPTTGDARACAWAFDAAADIDGALLIVAAGALPTAECVGALMEALDLDPLFGTAVPRFVDPGTARVHAPSTMRPTGDTLPLRVLASLPDYRVLSEHLAPCMLIRRELACGLPFGDGAGALWPALADYTVRARRAGFRTVQCNRAAADLPADTARSWGCAEEGLAAVTRAFPETIRTGAETPDARARNGERLLAAAVDGPQTLLLDGRNLTEVHNGTSLVILNICDALHRARPDASICLWVYPEASDHYRLASRYPKWRLCTSAPGERFAAGLRLSQPWADMEVDTLAERAAVTAYWMLDTISWDILYPAPPGLDAVWQRMAAEADGIFFISAFSRQRFENRFAARPSVLLDACPLSLHAIDYAVDGAGAAAACEEPYWLILGNRYDHKHIGPTVDLLSRAFPNKTMVVFGDRDQPRTARVRRFDSGGVDEGTVQSYYARAGVVVFPSFYEGFGLPIVQGLAYDRTVVARESPLVAELAAGYRGPGRLITFRSERSLVDILGRLERGEAVDGVPLGTNPATAAWTWDSTARALLTNIAALVEACPSPQMLERTGLSRGIMSPDRR